MLPKRVWDPGGEERIGQAYGATLLRILHDAVPRSVNRSAAVRQAVMQVGSKRHMMQKVTFDSGASSGNYIGREAISHFPLIEAYPCRHSAKLADGKSIVMIDRKCVILVSPINDYDEELQPIATEFYIVETLGNEAIIGLPDLLGNYFEYFSEILQRAATGKSRDKLPLATSVITDLDELCSKMEDELYKKNPSNKKLGRLVKSARRKLLSYEVVKTKVKADPSVRMVTASNADVSTAYLISENFGVVFDDDRVQNIVASMEFCKDNFLLINPGDIVKPWIEKPEVCPEDEDTPDPLSFNEDVLHFMEMSVEDSQREYLNDFSSHVNERMKIEVPDVLELLARQSSIECFAPSSWNGLKKVEPVKLETIGSLPTRLSPKARPVRESLFAHAKKEFMRLSTYFYENSVSPIASPLVIAPKATVPYIRFCGDYREVNKFIKIPQQPIPIIQHELIKAAKFKVFVDLDMANSFHQIPLSPEFSDLLSVKTPWGLVRPKFLPEGVGPASGLLQHIVRDIFSSFEEWTIVIFDNFLILADDYQDAYKKLELVLQKCEEYGIVLKLKKSWIGVDKVTFFGYEVTHGKWKLSDERKKAISEMPFPTTTKQMQSFLGAALFFHHHVPDYSEWTAKLYEMTHNDFVWDPGTWKCDYAKCFEDFKQALIKATELHFPDYSLPWILRCDASEHAVGSVLFQEFTDEKGEIIHQPIAFASKRFSGPASNWDTFKREAYAIYHGVSAFSYYLRGKSFIVESDHQNLQWIESSQSPIVVRWRSLLQSFDFLVRHIPGKENKVADWMSRMYTLDLASINLTEGEAAVEPEELSFDDMMRSVHGGKFLHFGASETWRVTVFNFET